MHAEHSKNPKFANFEAGQKVQTWSIETDPDWQIGVQIALISTDHLPLSQVVHEVAPIVGEYVPGGQLVQEEPSKKKPTLQISMH